MPSAPAPAGAPQQIPPPRPESGSSASRPLFARLLRGEERRAEERYGLSRASRHRRMRQIVDVLRRTGVFKGEMTPQKLRGLFEELGPTFVKVGQILSMRSEILPQEYCDELARLRTDVEPMTFEEVRAVLEAEYGGTPLEQVFPQFDPRPLGSASVAQVHRARLAGGEDVAVKVQRPDVQQTMASDLDILRRLCRRLGFIWKSNPVMDLNQMVEELWSTAVEETNFLVEARNLREFRELNAHCVYIDCPKPYEGLCTEHVVVMDYIEGISLDEPQRLAEAGYDLEEIGVKLVDNYATQVLDDGFFHADPHPANIIVSGGKIVYIDLGMTGRLSAHSRSCLAQIISSVGDQDSHGVAEGLVRFSLSNPAQVDRAQLLADVDAIVSEFGGTSLRDLDLGHMAFSLINLARKDRVELPAAVTMIARGLVTLEGVLDEYMPQGNMVQIIRDHIVVEKGVAGMAKEEARAVAAEGRRALHGTLRAAGEAGEFMHMLTRGKVKLNMKMVDSPEALGPLSRMVDRLTLGIIIAGLFIGSSIVYYAGIQPVVLGIPVLGFVGYAGAVVLSAWVILDILRDVRRRR